MFVLGVYDDPTAIRGYLPAELAWGTTRGVRVITPVAQVLEVPVLGAWVRWAEHRPADLPGARGRRLLRGVLPAPMMRYTELVTKTSAKLLTEALALTPEERMDLAAELVASVDGSGDPDWEQAWQVEVDRRAAAADLRSTPAPEWAEVRARVLAKLASR